MTSQWHDDEGQRARRYYSITDAGQQAVTRVPRRLGAVLRDGGQRAQPLAGAGRRCREGTAVMNGTALDHPLIRGYLRDLDAAFAAAPAGQARELREQITAHLQDALPPSAGDREVAAALARLGSPASLAAEASAGRPRHRPATDPRRAVPPDLAVLEHRRRGRDPRRLRDRLRDRHADRRRAPAQRSAGMVVPPGRDAPGNDQRGRRPAGHGARSAPASGRVSWLIIYNPTDWTPDRAGTGDHWARPGSPWPSSACPPGAPT